jgi:hypothetical protein
LHKLWCGSRGSNACWAAPNGILRDRDARWRINVSALKTFSAAGEVLKSPAKKIRLQGLEIFFPDQNIARMRSRKLSF